MMHGNPRVTLNLQMPSDEKKRRYRSIRSKLVDFVPSELSGQKFLNDVSVKIGQSIISPLKFVCQLQMINAQQME